MRSVTDTHTQKEIGDKICEKEESYVKLITEDNCITIMKVSFNWEGNNYIDILH